MHEACAHSQVSRQLHGLGSDRHTVRSSYPRCEGSEPSALRGPVQRSAFSSGSRRRGSSRRREPVYPIAMPLDPILSGAALRSLPSSARLVLLDCRVSEKVYRAGHLPEAWHAQLERDLSAPAPDAAHGGRHPLPDIHAFAGTLGRWGVTANTHVVAYDDQQGANAAARLWWLLKAVGHEHVQVVDGGLPALLAAGFTLTSAEPAPLSEANPYPVDLWQRARADIAEVDAARQATDRVVIDVRAATRYRGDHEPIDPVAGHIPGAHNLPLTDNLTLEGTFKTAQQLREQYTAAFAGITPESVIVHCGSGVTACHSLLALERAELHGAKLYVGSWSEWCRNRELPREPYA